MIYLVSNEQIKDIYNDKKIDFDRYNIEIKTSLSTKQFSVVVDFVNNEITGDCVAYGSWFDIGLDECIELLEEVQKHNKSIRNFKHIIENLQRRN